MVHDVQSIMIVCTVVYCLICIYSFIFSFSKVNSFSFSCIYVVTYTIVRFINSFSKNIHMVYVLFYCTVTFTAPTYVI